MSRVGRAITLTSLTTMAAFAANLFSDIAALRSFGIEAALGVLAAFILTGLWAPLIRVSVDDWLDARKTKTNHKEVKSIVNPEWLKGVTRGSGQRKTAAMIALVAVMMTVPAAIGMAQLEGDFAVEDFLDERSDFAIGVEEIAERFADEGEPANLLILGDVLDPRVFAAIDTFRQDMDALPEGVPNKITRLSLIHI